MPEDGDTMANSHEILFTHKDRSNSKLPTVSHIGGRLSEGVEWCIASEDAIEGILSGRFEFLVRTENGDMNKLVVAKHPRHGPYLKAATDDRQPDTLLNLPEAPQGELEP